MASNTSAPASNSGIGGLFSSITDALTKSVSNVANKTKNAVSNLGSGTAANVEKVKKNINNLKNAASNTVNGATTPAVVSPGVANGNSNAGMTGAPPNLTNEKVNPTATTGGRRIYRKNRTNKMNRMNKMNRTNRNRTNKMNRKNRANRNRSNRNRSNRNRSNRNRR